MVKMVPATISTPIIDNQIVPFFGRKLVGLSFKASSNRMGKAIAKAVEGINRKRSASVAPERKNTLETTERVMK